MSDEIQSVHVVTDVDVPARPRSGEGEQRWDVLSWVIRLLGGHVVGGG